MADHVTKAKRSAIMSAIRGKDTRPEMVVRRAAHRLGLRYRLHVRSLPGRPDLVLPKHGIAIFVNGCFWHGHVGCKRNSIPKSNSDFWKSKIEENTRRDAENSRCLNSLGWRVVVLWECEVRSSEMATAALREIFRQDGESEPDRQTS